MNYIHWHWRAWTIIWILNSFISPYYQAWHDFNPVNNQIHPLDVISSGIWCGKDTSCTVEGTFSNVFHSVSYSNVRTNSTSSSFLNFLKRWSSTSLMFKTHLMLASSITNLFLRHLWCNDQLSILVFYTFGIHPNSFIEMVNIVWSIIIL